MIHPPKIVWSPFLTAVLAACLIPTYAVAQNAQIRHIAVVHSNAGTEIQIETSKRLLPMTQVITDPDRLVIDFPDAVLSPQIHALVVDDGQIKSVRAALLSANPAMTRVVIDLKSPQDFQLVPTGKSVTVKFGGSAVANATTPTAVPVPAPAPAARESAVAPAPPPVISKPAVSAAARPTITIERNSVAPHPPLTAASAVTPASRTPVAPASVVSSTPSNPAPAASRTAQIRRVAVLKSGSATEIEIETSQRVVPTTQLIAGPDRLVLDFAGSLPGPLLRALAVNQGEVKGVRAGLLSSNPPVTRVVLDLKSPQEFQLFPSGNSVIVKLPGSASAASSPAPSPAPEAHVAPALPPEPPKKVQSSFQDGLLSLTSTDGSLAEVLNEIRLQTGAEIAVPAGAEQEKVAAVLGPASPREVLTQLLNGSRYNFIIVGSDSDANKVDKVILSAKNGNEMSGPTEPSRPEPVPVAEMSAPPARSVPGARVAPPPPNPSTVPPTDDSQPQGDSMPPDTPPQPGDPQPAPN